MKNFRTNKTFIYLHIIIFTLLIIFTLNSDNRETNLNITLLSLMIIISFYMLISSFLKYVNISDDQIVVKGLFKTTSIDINNICYGYVLSAVGRYVLIIHDGSNHPVMISSLNDSFEKIISIVSNKMNEEDREGFNIITPASLRRKYIIYAFIMTLIVALLLYGIITSYKLV